MPKTWTWPDISKIEMQWIGWIRNFLVYTVKGLIINCLTMSFCIFKTFLTFYSPNSMNTYLLVNIFSRCFYLMFLTKPYQLWHYFEFINWCSVTFMCTWSQCWVRTVGNSAGRPIQFSYQSHSMWCKRNVFYWWCIFSHLPFYLCICNRKVITVLINTFV